MLFFAHARRRHARPRIWGIAASWIVGFSSRDNTRDQALHMSLDAVLENCNDEGANDWQALVCDIKTLKST